MSLNFSIASSFRLLGNIWLLVFTVTGAACQTSLGNEPKKDSLTVFVARGALSELKIFEGEELTKTPGAIVEIASKPIHGVLRNNARRGFFNYQHGGASSNPDQFLVEYKKSDGSVLLRRQVLLEFRERHATLTITHPPEGALLDKGDIEVRYELGGTDYDHLHLALNNEGHNTIRKLTGKFILKDVPPGEHTIDGQLVDGLHRPLPLESAKKTVSIRVE